MGMCCAAFINLALIVSSSLDDRPRGVQSKEDSKAHLRLNALAVAPAWTSNYSLLLRDVTCSHADC